MGKCSKVKFICKFEGCSRRDDIISMIYLLIYLTNRDLPWFEKVKEENLKIKFKNILKMKLMDASSIADQDASTIYR